MDIGSSLGYGQTMEFRAISVPQPQQPSSPVPKMRQAALQQQREERMRRQQRRMNPDATTILRRKERQSAVENRMDVLPDRGTLPPGFASSQMYSPSSVAPGQQEALLPGASGYPPASPVAIPGRNLPPAAAPAQDTGMIQRISVARASFLITSATGISSILGLLQTFLFTYVLGRSALADAYLQAYIIPNLIYTVISGGALSSAFIPVFAYYSVGRSDEKTAWHIASSALNISAVLIIVFSGLAALFAPVIVPLYCPAPTFTPQDISLIILLTRIMLLQAVVLGSGVIVGAVLNSKQNFTRTALGTVLYNVGLIAGLLPGFIQTFHTRSSNPTDLAVYSATWGVVLGAILNVGVQVTGLPGVHMRYSFAFDWRHPGVVQIAKQMVPRIVNAVMLSFSTAVDRFLLAFLGAVVATSVLNGLINEYFQAFSILLLPVSIFGSSVSTATFPTLSSYVARERFDRVRTIIMETLLNILFLTIPSAVGLIILAFPIVQVLLEHGNFDRVAAEFSSVALLFFAIGLPALASVEIFTRSFYALQDSRTPVVISVAQFILKIALSILLINLAAFGVEWGVGALAFSTSIASILEALVLFILLYQRIGGFNLQALVGFSGRIFVSAGAMALVLLFMRLGLDHLIDTTSMKTLFIPGILMALVKLIIELVAGSATFLIVARLLHMEELNGGLVRRVIRLLRIPWL